MISLSTLAILLVFISYLSNVVLAASSVVAAAALEQHLDLCGGNGHIDSHALNIGSIPWNVAKNIKGSNGSNEFHYIDISPCVPFKSAHYDGYFIPNECQNGQICHKITSDGVTKSIGYSLKYINEEFGTVRATFVGPSCEKLMPNHTIDIRFICGNHLGHPSFPVVQINTKCRTTLNWETSAACKNQKPTSTFGSNEMKCYVLDDQNRLRDLTPLIRNGSYQVMSEDQELYINVCSDMNDKCSKDSSACIRNQDDVLESIGSYKWANMKFVSANEQSKHEYVELTYRSSSAKCKPNNAITKIRFICPKNFPNHFSISKVPTLISNLDCEYIIEWITDYACPLEDITKSAVKCQFKNVDLNKLNQTEFYFKRLDINDKPKDIAMNLCGGLRNHCSALTSVCLIDGQVKKSIGSKFEAQFVKADNRLNIVFQSKSATCSISGNMKREKTVVEMECDQTSSTSKPEFLGYSKEDCLYKFNLRTPIVCPLFEESPVCSYSGKNNKNQLIQVDLTPLKQDALFYSVKRDLHDPAKKYALPQTQEIEFNVCGYIPSTANLPDECHYSAACLVDKSNNKSFGIGSQIQPLTYNEKLNSYELVYSGGLDPSTNRSVSTKIIFFCQPYNDEVYLVGFNEQDSQYVVEFHTIMACPKSQSIGSNCVVKDELTNTIFDLKPLRSSSHYIIRNEEHHYEFELNVCGPILEGSCSPDSAVCQKELHGDRRNFSLGLTTSNLIYWNSMLNMTFTGGDRYNDANRTPRKSQISFICDPNAGKGHPEFIGEFNRSYSFVWYTFLACPNPVPKKSHCVFENETHFIDFTPLSLERGNHFVLDDNNSIIFINFCRSLNRIRDNQLKNCSSSSAVCLVNNFYSNSKSLNLGEPFDPPMMGYDGNVRLLYNNGDPCPHDDKISWTTNIQFQCDKELGRDLNIMMVEPDNRHMCTYEFIVQSPIACPQKLTDVALKNCIYVDQRTNLTADFSKLSAYIDYVIPTQKKSTSFHLNICKSVDSKKSNECLNSAVCLQNPDQSLVSYGKVHKLKIFSDENLHLRYTGGDRCDQSFANRYRSTDIELICDHNARFSKPELYFYDECIAKFRWRTPEVCNLKVPSCSLFDDNGNYYSLRQLSSLSHHWKVNTTNPGEYYLINVCKPLSTIEFGGSSAVFQCNQNGCTKSLGKVSDHELTLDPDSKHLLLTYEEEDVHKECNDKPLRTQIQFQCSKETGMNGPKFVNVNDCTHHFIWNTSFACSHNFAKDTNELHLDDELHLRDPDSDLRWDLSKLLSRSLIVVENRTRADHVEHYEYVFNFIPSSKSGLCANAAVCQTNGKGFYRDIGTLYNWKFMLDDVALHIVIHSNNSKCGRNPSKHATTKIFFECVENLDSMLSFLYESDDCEYYFLWKTSDVCSVMEFSKSSPKTNASHSKEQKSSSFLLPLILLLVLICGLVFTIHKYYNGITIRDTICRISNSFRRGSPTTNDVNFRYHQVSNDGL